MSYERARTPQDALQQLLDDAKATGTQSASVPLSEAQDALEAHSWRYARSMPKTPHWYTRIEDWDDPEAFYGCVATIRARGTVRYFKGWPYLELDLGDHVYWTMGYPVRDTTIINRRRVLGRGAW